MSPLETSSEPKPPCVIVHAEQCKGCGRCVVFCPNGVLALSQRHNRNGYRVAEAVKPEACTGCGLCFYACPEPGGLTVRRKPKKETSAAPCA